jgi:hypothetical protein
MVTRHDLHDGLARAENLCEEQRGFLVRVDMR